MRKVITEEEIKKLMDYLSTQKYSDVEKLIEMLKNLVDIEDLVERLPTLIN